ncbi:hypothetical protein E1B28_001829 [Marasmius oreades]|uniref:Uncharacterized protein n=1 Tax=Marasmius oreades TaxID=181124 RepID=A0A9P7V469_9AGAR|nr:uncharacterized protein E1B28_001829 [Marasmius oreades]KAG7100044.1 hypothetical protein E1B28_001829 [Marasmius oreades]
MSFFAGVSKSSLTFNKSSFNAVQGDIINHYYSAHSGDEQAEAGDFRHIRLGDVKLLKRVWSDDVQINARNQPNSTSRFKPNNPFRIRLLKASSMNSVKVTRNVYHVGVVGHREERFTATIYEQESESETGGREDDPARKIWRDDFLSVISMRHPHIPQLFGYGSSKLPFLVFHGGLVRGNEIFERYMMDKIVLCYLDYQSRASFENLYYSPLRDISLESTDIGSWWFNPENDSFQCDLTVVSRARRSDGGEPEQDHGGGRAGTVPQPSTGDYCIIYRQTTANAASRNIIDHFRRFLPDFITAISRLGHSQRYNDLQMLSTYSLDGTLTFGSIVVPSNKKIGPVVGYLESYPAPKWRFLKDNSYCPLGAVMACSSIENTAVRLTFNSDCVENREGKLRLYLRFALESPQENHNLYSTAFLSQANYLGTQVGCVPSDFVFLNWLEISLEGTIPKQSTETLYLTIPPIQPDENSPHVKLPLSASSMFFWSLSPQGYPKLTAAEIESRGLQDIGIKFYVGTSWNPVRHEAVRQYLTLENYDLYSKAYAQDRGYPLIDLSSGLIPSTSYNGDRPKRETAPSRRRRVIISKTGTFRKVSGRRSN